MFSDQASKQIPPSLWSPPSFFCFRWAFSLCGLFECSGLPCLLCGICWGRRSACCLPAISHYLPYFVRPAVLLFPGASSSSSSSSCIGRYPPNSVCSSCGFGVYLRIFFPASFVRLRRGQYHSLWLRVVPSPHCSGSGKDVSPIYQSSRFGAFISSPDDFH